MDKKYINVVDQDVACTYIYADSNGKACSDAAATNQVSTSELKEAFYAGCVIVASGVEYWPVSMAIASGVATLTYITVSGSTVAAATVVSKADA